MRLKQLLSVWALGICLPAVSMAAVGSQLTKVSVGEQGNATTVTLRASGAFTHTEYRPTENLMLVDLPGVAAGVLKDTGQLINRPGVASYRVVSYLGSNGSEVTRVEFILSPNANVKIAEGSDQLRLTVEGDANGVAQTAPATSAAPATLAAPATTAAAESPAAAPAEQDAQPVMAAAKQETPAENAVAAAQPETSQPESAAIEPQADAMTPAAPPSQVVASAGSALSDKPAVVRNVSVSHDDRNMAVEIQTSGPVQPVAMKLDSPDRIVVDIPNARLVGRQHSITVNEGGLKSVRVGRFQSDPPVTRVVLDLASAQNFELVPQGNNKVLVKLNSAVASAEKVAVPAQQPVSSPAAHMVRASATVRKTAVSKPVMAAEKEPVSVTKTQAAPEPAVAEQPMIVAAAASAAPAMPTQATPQPAPPKQMAQSAAKVMETSRQPAAPFEMPTMSASSAPTIEVAQAQTPPPSQAPMPAQNAAQQQQRQQAQAQNPAAPKYTGEPISVNLKDVDLQDFFRLIHEISGLNIVLDPNVKGTLTLVLDDVPWDQALDIVLQNNGLDRRLEGNVLRIATRETFTKEAEARRAQAEAQALAVDPEEYTHYLSYAHAADVVPLVKRFLTQRGEVLADPRTNALLIKDIPSVIPQVQHLLNQLDRKTQEVEIEARVVAATRNFARDIGTQLGFGWGNSTTAIGGGPDAGSSPINETYIAPPPYITVPGFNSSTQPPKPQALSIPLFSNLAVQAPTSALSLVTSAAGYRVDALLSLAESRGLLKILSRPRVVTQNNIGATVKQGVRVPVVTAAQLGGPPTVTYVEAALRLQVTPQVTAENTIFLNVDVENTTPDFSRQVQGNPTLITQQATTSVLVNDGGTVVIGGVIQTQNSVNTAQVPLLGDIPYLGNLFKRRSVATTTQELIFFITPKIVQT